MKGLASLLNKSAVMAEVRIPGSRIARMNQALKRRLDDDVEEIFNRACATNDLESARDLFALLEKWHERRAGSYGRERRINGAALDRTRRELERLTTLHEGKATATQPPGLKPR